MNKKFTDEFKKDAVKLANEIGCVAAAEKLDIKVKNLYTWRKTQRIASGSIAIKGMLPGETPEATIRRLEKEAN